MEDEREDQDMAEEGEQKTLDTDEREEEKKREQDCLLLLVL